MKVVIVLSNSEELIKAISTRMSWPQMSSPAQLTMSQFNPWTGASKCTTCRGS